MILDGMAGLFNGYKLAIIQGCIIFSEKNLIAFFVLSTGVDSLRYCLVETVFHGNLAKCPLRCLTTSIDSILPHCLSHAFRPNSPAQPPLGHAYKPITHNTHPLSSPSSWIYLPVITLPPHSLCLVYLTITLVVDSVLHTSALHIMNLYSVLLYVLSLLYYAICCSY